MKPIVTILEQDQDAMHLLIHTAEGDVTVMANECLSGSTLELNRVHVKGSGLNPSIIRRAAKFLGERAGVHTVIVRGGVRTGGARPGQLPKPFTIEVSQ